MGTASVAMAILDVRISHDDERLKRLRRMKRLRD
jgi:hypothetical protein